MTLNKLFILLALIPSFAFGEEHILEAPKEHSNSSVFDIMGSKNGDSLGWEDTIQEQEIIEQPTEEMVIQKKSKGDYHNTAVIKIIDKKAGRLEKIEVPILSPKIRNEKTLIRILACWKEGGNNLRPDSKALIEFYSISVLNRIDKQFSSWISSRNPAAPYYNHDKYDYTLEDCIDR